MYILILNNALPSTNVFFQAQLAKNSLHSANCT